jgi:tetratricopeptide (TPR) repeat protein
VRTKAKLVCGIGVASVLLLNAAIALGVGYLISFERGLVSLKKGHAAMDRHDYDAALAQYSAALNEKLTRQYQAVAYQGRGACEVWKGQRANAMRDYTESLRLNPALDWTYRARGSLYEQDKELEKAFNDYSEAIRLNPNAGEAYLHRGMIFKLRHQNIQAIADFSEAARCQPSNAVAYRERGECYFRENDLDGALASFDAVISVFAR